VSPIIDIQRRLVEAGRIRAGEKGEKGEPRKLDKWRLTSKDRRRLELAAELWGGEVREWEGHKDEYELYTSTNELPIALIPGQLPTTWYELWSKGGCQRRCDGQHELISDSACLCGEERECKPHTRLSVLLPDLPGLGSWLVSSTGWNAASELAASADLLQRASAQGVLLPARLRLEQRVQVSGGQTKRFAVPVIDLDVSLRDLLGAHQGALSAPSEQRALPSGYVPIAGNGGNGVSLEEGLTAAESQTVARGARSAAPIPAQDDLDFDGAPIPVEDTGASPPSPAADPSAAPSGGAPAFPKPTKRQLDKLNVLVGRLREAGAITTEHLWSALAKARNVDVDVMIELLSGRDEEGALHWSPLRDSLTRPEASDLIDRLEKLEKNVGAAA
jgi:hypothetical protein